MAKDGPGGEKTEKPTPQRLKKARKEGQIPRTQELGTWLGVAAASVLLPMLVSNAFDAVQKMFVQVGAVASNPEPEALSTLMGQALTAFLTTVPRAAVLMSALTASQSPWVPNIFLMPGKGFSFFIVGFIDLVAKVTPPCAALATVPTTIMPSASGSTAVMNAVSA